MTWVLLIAIGQFVFFGATTYEDEASCNEALKTLTDGASVSIPAACKQLPPKEEPPK